MADDKKKRVVTMTDSMTGKSLELPVLNGVEGAPVIDIRGIHKETGLFTFDPGFTATAACKSKLTFIDGDEGLLMHGGYSIDELAEKSDFLEVSYLLLNGKLPSKEQKLEFDRAITLHTMVHEQIMTFFRGFRRDAHPMAILCGVTGALSAFYHDSTDISDPVQRMVASRRLIAKMPTLASMAFKYSLGQPFNYPKNDLNYSENFLHMCFATPTEEYKINPVLADAMDKILILHADHEQNASTSTVRLAGSSGANPFACIAAGIAALWGRPMAAPMKLSLICLARSATGRGFLNTSSALGTRKTPSDSLVSGIGSIRVLIPAPVSCVMLVMTCLNNLESKKNRFWRLHSNWKRSR